MRTTPPTAKAPRPVLLPPARDLSSAQSSLTFDSGRPRPAEVHRCSSRHCGHIADRQDHAAGDQRDKRRPDGIWINRYNRCVPAFCRPWQVAGRVGPAAVAVAMLPTTRPAASRSPGNPAAPGGSRDRPRRRAAPDRDLDGLLHLQQRPHRPHAGYLMVDLFAALQNASFLSGDVVGTSGCSTFSLTRSGPTPPPPPLPARLRAAACALARPAASTAPRRLQPRPAIQNANTQKRTGRRHAAPGPATPRGQQLSRTAAGTHPTVAAHNSTIWPGSSPWSWCHG
jgi:hypothetical protein